MIRDKLRAALEGFSVETQAEAIDDLIRAAAEIARALHVDLPEILEHVAEAYAEAHGLQLEFFECEKEAPNQWTTVAITTQKYRDN